ncbi:hypothetical protein RFI_13482, partial [Reticulomyxa filosa]
KLLQTRNRQQKATEKEQILQNVERSLLNVQNEHNHKLGKMRKAEEAILERLQRTKASKSRAERIKYAERSHRHWAFAKLDFTLKMTTRHNDYLQKKSAKEKKLQQEVVDNGNFANEMKTFLSALKSLTEHQEMTVKEYENSIENMELDLFRIRHEVSKIRQNTFTKIYELHKYVEIADALDLGQRRISVVSIPFFFPPLLALSMRDFGYSLYFF